MSYASDRGLKVGSKIKALEDSDFFSINEILTMVKDDGIMPDFRSEESGEVNPFCITRNWEHYKEEDKGVTSATAIKFPCCVPTSEIKDAETLLALVTLFEANGAIVYDGNDFDRVEDWEYFGVSLRSDGHTFRTDFYIYCKHYNQSQIPTDITMYSVVDLLGKEVQDTDNEEWVEWNGVGTPVIEDDVCELKFRDGTVEIDGDFTVSSWRWEHYNERDIVAYRIYRPSVASQEAITERLEDNLSVGIDLADEGSEKTVEALVSITQEVKYTVVIKGTTFTFTQEELDALAEELLGFTTL